MRIPQMAIPLTPVKGADSMSLLEANHHRYFKEGMKHVAHRGGGPFGSIGYDQAKADDLERLHGAVPTSRPDPVIMAEVSAGSSNALKRVLKKRYLVPLMASEASVPLTLTRDIQYVGSIGVGQPAQYFHPIFDTGSTNTWLIGDLCVTQSCLKVNQYKPKLSRSYRETNSGSELDISVSIYTYISIVAESNHRGHHLHRRHRHHHCHNPHRHHYHCLYHGVLTTGRMGNSW
eukprot:GHVU01050272.1.p1 GENE.GHVU01050272.1~~GHVU01050272.1.p1  ORF type:complete len:232 (-),score=11.75 GHVU01050272.1:254-949(-)